MVANGGHNSLMILASSSRSVAPSLSVGYTTNYNQNSAVFNAVVNTTGNRNITLVEFQHSLQPDFSSGNSAWFTATTNSSITQGAVGTACTYNATGLTPATNYHVRIRATNSSGFTTTSSMSGAFTTYVQYVRQYTSSLTWINARPTSGTSGLALVIDELVCFGGGGGATFGGGAGGTLQSYTNINITGSSTVPILIGAGGAAGYYDFTTGSFINGTNGVFSSFGNNGAGGGNRGNGLTDPNYDGGSGNGFSGGLGASSSAGGGGAGLAGAGGNASGDNGGAGGAGAFGTICRGGGGTGALFSIGIPGSPSGAGAVNTGSGGGGAAVAGQFSPSAGGSGLVQLTFFGPVGVY